MATTLRRSKAQRFSCAQCRRGDEVFEWTAMSLIGTFATCQLHRAMSAFRGTPEDMCSCCVLLVLSAPCQLLVLAGPEHGRTIPLAEVARTLRGEGVIVCWSAVPLRSVDAML